LIAMPGQLPVTAPLVGMGAILVNQAGRRFTDETTSRLELATRVRAQPGHVAYLVFDDRIANAAREADPFFGRVVLPRTGRRAATLEHLSKQLELDVNGLRATIDGLGAGGDAFGRQNPPGAL